jgi:hypothetical protein
MPLTHSIRPLPAAPQVSPSADAIRALLRRVRRSA